MKVRWTFTPPNARARKARAGATAKQGLRSAWIIPLSGFAMGEPDKGEGPGGARPGERADQGRSAPNFRVEPESGTKKGEPRTCQRSRIGAQ